MKTYAHALKLHEERLQDTRKRKGQLEHAIDMKRLELLTLRAEQRHARMQIDPGIAQQIADVKARIAAYEMSKQQVPELADLPKGLIQLRKKTAEGSLMPTHNSANTAPASSAAE